VPARADSAQPGDPGVRGGGKKTRY
jgi:hypothetical protein